MSPNGGAFVVPFRLEGVGDEAVLRVDLHIAATCELGIVARPLEVLRAQGIGLGGARF
jgi:hypothetical protein